MGFWYHSILIIVFSISFLFYFIYHRYDIVKYNTVSRYSSVNIIGRVFILTLTILMSLSLSTYWWMYLSYVKKVRIKIYKINSQDIDILLIYILSSLSFIGLMMVGIFPVLSEEDLRYYNNTMSYEFDKYSSDLHISGVVIFVLLSLFVCLIDVFSIKRNIRISMCVISKRFLILVYVFTNILCFILFIYYYTNPVYTDLSRNFITIVFETISLYLLVLYPLLFCHYNNNINGDIGLYMCCVLYPNERNIDEVLSDTKIPFTEK